LISAGANINAENYWKITPVNLAMLKNISTCVKKILEQEPSKSTALMRTARPYSNSLLSMLMSELKKSLIKF